MDDFLKRELMVEDSVVNPSSILSSWNTVEGGGWSRDDPEANRPIVFNHNPMQFVVLSYTQGNRGITGYMACPKAQIKQTATLEFRPKCLA